MQLSLSRSFLGALGLAVMLSSAAAAAEGGPGHDGRPLEGVEKIRLLPPTPNNPRNSEGDFIELRDGRILFVYTHFTGGGSDHATAHLAARASHDGGQSWSDQDTQVVANDGGMNIMSVSLLRLADGRIALFYMRKNSLTDCRPVLRFSDDEARSWSEPVTLVPDTETGYYVLNNDRVVQLTSGRLVVPLAQHQGREQSEWTPYGRIRCYFSDDGGRTWARGGPAEAARGPGVPPVMLQEPGVVELRDGRLMLFCRTDAGSQYLAHSEDGGERWTTLEPSAIQSPRSPASIERIRSTGDLLLVWNDHAHIPPQLRGKRTPLAVALSRDEGKSWQRVGHLEDDPHGWYCYTAIALAGEHVLLGHCAGDRRRNNGLAETQITRFPVESLYQTER